MRPTAVRLLPSDVLAAVASHSRSAPALSSVSRDGQLGPPISYGALSSAVRGGALRIRSLLKGGDSSSVAQGVHRGVPVRASGQRTAFLASAQPPYAAALLSVFASGGVAVPLSPLYPDDSLTWLVRDVRPSLLVGEIGTLGDRVQRIRDAYGIAIDGQVSNDRGETTNNSNSTSHNASPLLCSIGEELVLRPTSDVGQDLDMLHNKTDRRREQYRSRLAPQYVDEDLSAMATELDTETRAMILYTSGTTGAPKGVVWTHGMLDYQVSTMHRDWRWNHEDRIINALPLHHVHGIVNVVLTSLYAGAHCLMMPAFSAEAVWRAIVSNHNTTRQPTVFMGVPTMYQRLIQYYHRADRREQESMRRGAAALRLYVCGSAALLSEDNDAWKEISGQRVLERYGMTETGMVLSNPYQDRVPSSLGVPFRGTEIKVSADVDGGAADSTSEDSMSEDSTVADSSTEDSDKSHAPRRVQGELLVRGPGVFKEYWNRETETKSAFDTQGWFKTGDYVEMDPITSRCRMLGRLSTDIIKTGGYKVSGLEVERAVANAKLVDACAVVGLPDSDLGERIVCVVETGNDRWASLDERAALEETILTTLRTQLPRYKSPRDVMFVQQIPRNALGKVLKKSLVAQLTGNAAR